MWTVGRDVYDGDTCDPTPGTPPPRRHPTTAPHTIDPGSHPCPLLTPSIPNHTANGARIAGSVTGVCLACIGALVGGYDDWVGNALEGAIVCGIAGALLGPVITASPRTSRKVLIIALAGILACTAGTANLLRNAGWWARSDALIEARLDPMASSHLANYRLCSRGASHTDLWTDYQSIVLRFDSRSTGDKRSMTRAVEKATRQGWTGSYESETTWTGRKPRIASLPGTYLNITIRDFPPPYSPGIDASCDLIIYIGT